MRKRDDTRIALDVHAHLVPLEVEALARFDGIRLDGETPVIEGHKLGIASLFRPQALLDWMRQHAVAHAWVSIPPPAYRQHLGLDAARAWHAALDRALSAVAAADAARLTPLHYLPLEHAELALEIAQAAARSGDTHFTASAGGHPGILYSDPRHEPLWQVLDECAAIVFIHPGHCCDGRLDSFYLSNLLGNPYETAVAASHLVLGGVCTRHPHLRFCLAHGGGVTAAVAGRLQRGYDKRRPGVMVGADSEPPKEALRRFWVDSIAHDTSALALAARVFGEGHVLFGSDWPFPMGLPDPMTQLHCLSDGRLRRVLCSNAEKLGLV